MSAAPAAIPAEIHLRHVTWRQGSRFGTWMEAAIVDGKLVAESPQRLDASEPLMLRITGLDGASVAMTASSGEVLEEPGQAFLILIPLPLEPSDLLRLAAKPVSEQALPSKVQPSVRPGFVLSMALSISALIGAIALNFIV